MVLATRMAAVVMAVEAVVVGEVGWWWRSRAAGYSTALGRMALCSICRFLSNLA